MVIDPTSDIGRIRLRIADVSDIPYLADSVIQATLDDCGGNLPKAAKSCAMYVLGMLSHKTRRRMNQLEVYGSDAATAYRAFLLLAYTNPAFMDVSPLPYAATADFSPILDFQANWNAAYTNGTESQSLARMADTSPNDNSRTGWGF